MRRVPQAFRFFFRLICVIDSVLFLSGLELLCGLEGLLLLFGLLQRLLVLGSGKLPHPTRRVFNFVLAPGDGFVGGLP